VASGAGLEPGAPRRRALAQDLRNGHLKAHHGRLARRLLEPVLGEPEFRLRSILAGVQRLLNVDGYQVLAVDDISGTVALNRQLLNTQFQLEGI
jgi:hypothetical protein